MSSTSSPPYICWASADDWRPGHVMLGANVDSIPSPPPRSDVIVGSDGLWGSHEWTVYPQLHQPEFPYLAWIPIHPFSDIQTRAFDKSILRRVSHSSNTWVVDPELLGDLNTRWKSIKASLEAPFKDISSTSVQCPRKAYARAFEALNRLEMQFATWRDYVEVSRNLQRSFLELSAFLNWWRDVRSDSIQPIIRAATRGAIFEDAQLYEGYVRLSVGSLLLIQRSTLSFVLDPTLEVTLSPRNSCERPMSLQPLVHSLPHWYYPPLVHDVLTELESAARGYTGRLDTFNPTTVFKRKLDKVQNKMNDQAGRVAKKAKVSMAATIAQPYHPELIRLKAAGAAPDWFPRLQEVWTHAVSHVSHTKLASYESPRRFALPPVHLFWGGHPSNQRVYFHHFLVLFDEIKDRPKRNLPPLTTQEWRDVLGNTYWKRHWAKCNGDDLSTFDPDVFWKYGGPLLFGDQRSADIAAQRYNPTSALPCFCNVQVATADDSDVREVALYRLNSFHIYEEVKQMERVLFPTTFEKRWELQADIAAQIAEWWTIYRDKATRCDFSLDNEAWTQCVRVFRDVVKDWDGFNKWDWGTFSEPERVVIRDLSTQDFRRFAVCLFAFYVHSFVTRLGFYPSPFLRPPVLGRHSCADHRKKFAEGSVAQLIKSRYHN